MNKLRTNTKKYAEEVRQLDTQDWESVLEAVAPEPTRCAGNRLIVPHRACIHCGSSDPSATCRQTAEQAIQAKHDREIEIRNLIL